MQVVAYSETERPWFRWFFVIPLLFCAVVYSFWGWELFRKGWMQGDVIPFFVTLVPTFAILSSLVWSCSKYSVCDDGLGLEFGFNGWWRKRFIYSDITEVRQVEIRWQNWGGFGWRWRPGRIGYIVRSGPGVQVTTHRSGRSYTFNCRDCDSLLNGLGKAGVRIVREAK